MQTQARIVNFGSINIDHVYAVDRFVQPGETVASRQYARHCGGKGLNQSVAAVRAGAEVSHAGRVGHDGRWCRERLIEEGVDTCWLEEVDVPTGHAVIQVEPSGENCIIVEGGANRSIDESQIQRVTDALTPKHWLLVQNEVNDLDRIIAAAHERGIPVALNPTPVTDIIGPPMLCMVDLLFVNATEGAALTGQTSPDAVMDALGELAPDLRIVLTLGARGAIYADVGQRIEKPAPSVKAVDTTAAGDTFVGYFLAAGDEASVALDMAARAAALCATRSGAADAIPSRREVEAFRPSSGTTRR